MSLRTQLFKYHVRKRHKTVQPKQFVDYAHAKSVLLIYESDLLEKRSVIDNLAQKLRNDGKQVSIIGYVHKKLCESRQTAEFTMLDKAQVGWWRKPNAEMLESLAKQHFDIAIDLTQRTCLPLQYALLYANATCKIGSAISQYGLTNFIIDISGEEKSQKIYEQTLFDAIVHYLKEIKQIN